MQVCSACRAENRAGSRFCSSCGASLAPAPFDEPEVHRIVTVLFCDLMGSTRLGESLDSESLRRVMSRYYEEMRRVLERHGHPACRFIGDAVMAVFGIPTLSEDDALRAVRAADEMRTALVELNDELERRWGVRLSARTGVNTGEVVVDARSGDELFVVGDAVNVAARLEQAAPEAEILIGEETYRLVRGAVEVEPVEPLTLRGKSRPVTAHRVLEIHPEVSGIERLDSPFVGRERELELLDEAFQRSLAERSCVVITVLGEAGVGKSRLTHEFLGGLGDRGRVVRGRCLPHGAGTTFWPIAGVVKEAAAISEEDSPEAARARISSLLGGADDSPVIAERVAGAVGLAEPAAHREETFWAVRKLLEALALEGPLVVAFDDIHLGEPTFLDLIEHIASASQGQPMLLVCTARPELLEERPAFPNGGGGGSVLRLNPLGERESRVMVENLMGGGELAEEGIERVTRAAEGNPLFLEQIVRMLIDERRGHLDADGAALALPPTIQALVAARLDRLTPAERALAQRASVVGREFWPGALYELSPDASRREVNGHLEALLDKQLVRPGGTPFAGEDAICFTHLLIRDVAYQAMLKEVRAELHERFAAWLERGAGDRASEYEEILGYHLEQACRYREKLGLAGERTVALAREAAQRVGVAGRRALARGDTPAARNLLERAVSLLPDDDPLQRELSLKLSIALAETGELSRADAVLSERIAAERRGRQFLVYRDGSGRQQVAELEPTQPRVTIGRKAENDICLGWDSEVSRRHADIEWVGDRWELVDERLSHNGSHVNGERVDGRRGLKDGDVLRFGETAMLYRAPTLSGRRLPSPAESASTATRPVVDGPS